jgi:hypothetical protein
MDWEEYSSKIAASRPLGQCLEHDIRRFTDDAPRIFTEEAKLVGIVRLCVHHTSKLVTYLTGPRDEEC